MCLILFAIQPNQRYRFVFAANRDESHQRPTQSLGFWSENSDILAGRDLSQGGTWMGLTRSGRFAGVTNFRRGQAQSGIVSRGALTANFLKQQTTPVDYIDDLVKHSEDFAGFNLLIGDHHGLYYYSNAVDGQTSAFGQALAPGLYGLSNGELNADWPKIHKGRQGLKGLLTKQQNHNSQAFQQRLFDLLADQQQAPIEVLPHTGISVEREQTLSPLFIKGDTYGTRASTVLLIQEDGFISMVERSFNAAGVMIDSKAYEFYLDS